MEYIFKRKAEASRTKMLSDQAQARRERVAAARKRREDRLAKRRQEMIAQYAKEEKKAKK